jgi:hypothetical protein
MYQTFSSKTKSKGMAQVVEHLPSQAQSPEFKSSTEKKKLTCTKELISVDLEQNEGRSSRRGKAVFFGFQVEEKFDRCLFH